MGSKYDAIGDFSVCGCVSIAWISEPSTKSPPRRRRRRLRMLKMFDINVPFVLFDCFFYLKLILLERKKMSSMVFFVELAF